MINIVDISKMVKTEKSISYGKYYDRELKMDIKKITGNFLFIIHYHKRYLEIVYTDYNKFDFSRLIKEDLETQSRFGSGDGTRELRKAKHIIWKRVDSELSKIKVYFNKSDINMYRNFSSMIEIKINEDDTFFDIFSRFEKEMTVSFKNKRRRKEHIDIYTYEIYGNIILHGLNKYSLEEVILNRVEEID